MHEGDFKRWLEEQQYKASTIATQLSSARSIEQAYGDLDQLYERDAFDALVEEFTYSARDRTANRPNPTKLKLSGDTYRDLAHLRATLSYYRKFKEGSTRLRKDMPLPEPAIERAMDECAEVGAITFMDTYGFSWNNVEYYAVRDGALFPAKAIFAVAHQCMPSGVALDSKTSNGTEARQRLASLGYEVAKRGPVMLFDKDGPDVYEHRRWNKHGAFYAERWQYVVAADPLADAPGRFSGLCSLQIQQAVPNPAKPGVKTAPRTAFRSVGDSTDFQPPGSTTLNLSAGTYRFSATRNGASLATIKPAT